MEKIIPIVLVSVFQLLILMLFWLVPSLNFDLKEVIQIMKDQLKTILSRNPSFFAFSEKSLSQVKYNETHMTKTVITYSVVANFAI